MENSEFQVPKCGKLWKNRFRQRQYLYGRYLQVKKCDEMLSFLAWQQISWQFSRLNRAPYWNARSSTWCLKSEGNVELNFDELREVAWDVESVEEAVPWGAASTHSHRTWFVHAIKSSTDKFSYMMRRVQIPGCRNKKMCRRWTKACSVYENGPIRNNDRH